MIINRAATKTLGEEFVLKFITNIDNPIETRAYDFGIDIRELYDEIVAEG